ncbi:MAG: hypothetical protein HYX89_06165 [Chloroflexi bacterium]|nr:hypothetical protein [Chloroflexota bacterium]
MAEEPKLEEIYADQFRLTLGPYGATLTFGVSPAHPDPVRPESPHELVRIRMSLEHLKVMTMILRRQLGQYEQQNRLNIPLPESVLSQLGLSMEDW